MYFSIQFYFVLTEAITELLAGTPPNRGGAAPCRVPPRRGGQKIIHSKAPCRFDVEKQAMETSNICKSAYFIRLSNLLLQKVLFQVAKEVWMANSFQGTPRAPMGIPRVPPGTPGLPRGTTIQNHPGP